MWRSLGAVPLGGAHRRVGGERGVGGGVGGRGLPDSVASGGCRCVEGAAMLLCLNYPVTSTTIEINPGILLPLVWAGSEKSSQWKSSFEHFGGWLVLTRVREGSCLSLSLAPIAALHKSGQTDQLCLSHRAARYLFFFSSSFISLLAAEIGLYSFLREGSYSSKRKLRSQVA